MGNALIRYDKIYWNTWARRLYHSSGIPSATINIKPVTNLTDELSQLIKTMSSKPRRNRSPSKSISNSRAGHKIYGKEWNRRAITELWSSNRQDSVASSYGKRKRSWIYIIFPHFHSNPRCKEKGHIQPQDSGAPLFSNWQQQLQNS
jgi:hypothetical protein